ncbi:MAG: hypothetical protein PHN85_07780, partial [Kiritimatiellae bacterium]|nr:hypothetical protein [Kiritimatiellia bacterium]
TETNDWTLTESNGAQHITQVRDRANGLRLYHETAAYAPIFSTDAGLTCNGLPVADFGAAAEEHSQASSIRYALHFNRPLESVRAVYAVWRLKAGSCSFFMGSSNADRCGVSTDGRYDWHRGSLNGGSVDAPLFGNNTAAAIKNGEILTNGVAFAYTEKPVDDEWRLMEVHTTKGVHISAFGTDRGTIRTGGMALGEVLVYERPLNAREKVATRNYLLKKWFGKSDEELAPLPEIAEADAPRVGSLLVDETTELDLNGGFAVTRLYGDGTLLKSGEGTLEITDALAYSGTVHVAEGAFRLFGHAPDDTPELATRGLAFHLDAEQGVIVTTNGSGRVEAPVWNSVLNDGWKAVSATGTYSSVTVNSTAQYVPEPELDGRPSVRMAAYGNGTYECYRFVDPNGEWKAITNIRSALWVLGSQEGGGFLFGGGDHSGVSGTSGKVKYYAWHRGSATTESAGRHKEDPLTSTSGFSEVYDYSVWRVNGTAHGALDANPLSGGWDVVSCRLADGHAGPADGLAYDGRIFAGENYLTRCGNQRLAELLVYTNRLSDAELLQTEAYLNGKWRLNGCIDGFENEMKVVVDGGAVLDCGGHRQYVASLGGEGIVSNGTIVAGAVIADAGAATLTVDGTFEISAGMRVELMNLASLGDLRGKTIPVLSAASYAGLENLSTVVFTGETFTDGLVAKLRVVDGILTVTFSGKGSAIFFK